MLIGFIFIGVFAIVAVCCAMWYHARMLQALVLQHARERSILEDRVADAMRVPRPTIESQPEPEFVSTPDWYAHVGKALDKVPEEWVEIAGENN